MADVAAGPGAVIACCDTQATQLNQHQEVDELFWLTMLAQRHFLNRCAIARCSMRKLVDFQQTTEPMLEYLADLATHFRSQGDQSKVPGNVQWGI